MLSFTDVLSEGGRRCANPRPPNLTTGVAGVLRACTWCTTTQTLLAGDQKWDNGAAQRNAGPSLPLSGFEGFGFPLPSTLSCRIDLGFKSNSRLHSLLTELLLEARNRKLCFTELESLSNDIKTKSFSAFGHRVGRLHKLLDSNPKTKLHLGSDVIYKAKEICDPLLKLWYIIPIK